MGWPFNLDGLSWWATAKLPSRSLWDCGSPSPSSFCGSSLLDSHVRSSSIKNAAIDQQLFMIMMNNDYWWWIDNGTRQPSPPSGNWPFLTISLINHTLTTIGSKKREWTTQITILAIISSQNHAFNHHLTTIDSLNCMVGAWWFLVIPYPSPERTPRPEGDFCAPLFSPKRLPRPRPPRLPEIPERYCASDSLRKVFVRLIMLGLRVVDVGFVTIYNCLYTDNGS